MEIILFFADVILHYVLTQSFLIVTAHRAEQSKESDCTIFVHIAVIVPFVHKV